jgi:hypothetical protein
MEDENKAVPDEKEEENFIKAVRDKKTCNSHPDIKTSGLNTDLCNGGMPLVISLESSQSGFSLLSILRTKPSGSLYS